MQEGRGESEHAASLSETHIQPKSLLCLCVVCGLFTGAMGASQRVHAKMGTQASRNVSQPFLLVNKLLLQLHVPSMNGANVLFQAISLWNQFISKD